MENLLVTFSGGETSAYMTYWINKYWKDKFNIVNVFANTGEEHEETLKFVDRFSKHYGININWVEAKTNKKGTSFRVKNFISASRNGEPFEEVIKKYGVPNESYPHCTRELKLAPITKFVKEKIGFKKYYTAVGIRSDEVDRVNNSYKELKLLYPLITEQPMTKQKINFWWSNQPFRLNLKGYQGNCKTCWKKSDKKLRLIARENPEWFDNFKKWEEKYKHYFPKNQSRDNVKLNTFFRNYRTVEDIINESKIYVDKVIDDHKNTNYQTSILDKINENESCDIYSNCGD